MSFAKSKKVRIAITLLAMLLLIQFISYFWYAETISPRTGIRHLSDYGLLRSKKFAVVEKETWDPLSEAQRAVLAAELGLFVGTIYHSMSEVPENSLVFMATTEIDKTNYESWKHRSDLPPQFIEEKRRELEAGRRIVGLKDGIRIGCHVDNSGLFWMKCSAGHWVSGLGAEGRTDVYIWVLGFWMRVYNLGHFMA